MKRGWAVGLLLLFAAGVGAFLLWTRDEGPRRRGSGSASESGASSAREASPSSRPPEPPAPSSAGRDDDPNRIPGADLTVQGVVLKGEAPVEGATVLVRPATPLFQTDEARARTGEGGTPAAIAETRSDAAGRFRLAIPRRKAFHLEVHARGCAFRQLYILAPEVGDPEEIVVRLQEGDFLQGRVVDARRAGVAGAKVSLGQYSFRFLSETKTDAEGRFRLDDLPSAAGVVDVEAEGWPLHRHYVDLNDVSDLLIVLRKGGAIAGTIRDDAGAPIAGASLDLSVATPGVSSPSGSGKATSDAAGTWRIASILPGVVNGATVRHPDYGVRSTADLNLPTALVREGEELRWDIVVKRGVLVRGIVLRGSDDLPVAGAEVTLLRFLAQYRSLGDSGYALSGPDGRFEFRSVLDGSYAIEARIAGGGRFAVRYAQGQRPRTIDFYVEEGVAPPEQRVRIEPAGAVEGNVIHVAPERLTNTQISLQVDTLWLSALVDATGLFRFPCVPATERATVQCYDPPLTAPPFAVEAGKTTKVIVDPASGIQFAGIVEDESGTPIEGARVIALPEPLLGQASNFMYGYGTTRSDAEGRYTAGVQEWMLQNYSKGKIFLIATHRDHADTIIRDLATPVKGQTTNVRITMLAGGRVSGRALWVDGTPANDARVSLVAVPQQGAPPDPRPGRQAVTDAEGAFEFRGVGPGEWNLTIWHPEGKAPLQQVRAGAEGLLLRLEPTLSIAGIVLDEEGRPLAQANVDVLVPAGNKESRQRGVTDQNGRFRVFQVPPGAFPLEVSPQQGNYNAPCFEVTRVPPIAAGTDDAVITVQEGARISGRVLDPGGAPVAGAGVVAMPVQLSQEQMQRAWETVRPTATTNSRGEFLLKGVGKDPVEIVAVGPGYLPGTLAVQPGTSDVTLRLEAGGVISGRILMPDGSPARSAWMWFNATSPEVQQKTSNWQMRGGQSWSMINGWQMQSAQTDGQGRFRITSLYPGEYQLNLQITGAAVPPTTLRTGQEGVLIQLITPLKISGRVMDEQGRPPAAPPGQPVWINAQRGDQFLASVQMAEDGTFELENIAPGRVKLNVYVPGRRPVSMEVDAGAQGVEVVVPSK